MTLDEKVLDFVTKMLQSYEDEESVEKCCNMVVEEIRAKLRRDSDETNPAVVMAAVAMAYQLYLVFKNTENGGVTSFKAGDVSVEENSDVLLEAANDFAAQKIADAARYFKDSAFVFKVI
ncbi:MAG: hypothetical protein LUG85_00965 [Clostridiales bacterium]|nr:hypothetical protein [Clostridiales bacterium]